MFGMYAVDQNGRVLTVKYIEAEPYPWLEKLEKSAEKITPEIERVFNSHLQGKNAEKSALYSSWWGRIVQVLTIYKEDIREKWRLASHDIIVERRMNDRF